MDIIHETAELSGYKIVVAPSHFVTNPATVKNITSFVTHGGTVILTPRTDVEFFVPMGDNCEVDRLTLTNETDMEKQFTVFSYLEFCLWNAVDDSTNFQRNFSTGEVEVEGSTIYHKTEYRERRDHYTFWTVNAPLDGFDTSRDAFLGAYRSNANPEVVENGQCTGSAAHGWAPVGVHQVNVTLKPGEKKSLIFVLGYIENAEDEKWAAVWASGIPARICWALCISFQPGLGNAFWRSRWTSTMTTRWPSP